MKNYYINRNTIGLPAKNGGTIVLTLTSNSGRIVYRDKINTLIGVKHPGIELGIDQHGKRWVLHHHYENNYPAIEREDLFAKGEPVFYDLREVNYNKFEIVQRSLDAWNNGTEYHWLWNNCQHLVNNVTRNKNSSEAIDQISNGAMITGGVMALIGLASKNKTLINIGLGVKTLGSVGKGLSRMK